MRTRLRFSMASWFSKLGIGVGLLAMLASLPISAEDGPLPADQVIRKKQLAKIVLFTGGGFATLAALGGYAIGCPRPDLQTEEPRR